MSNTRFTGKSKAISFDDIQDWYYTESSDTTNKNYDGINQFLEEDKHAERDYNTEAIPKNELEDIYGLVKPDFKDEIYDEEQK